MNKTTWILGAAGALVLGLASVHAVSADQGWRGDGGRGHGPMHGYWRGDGDRGHGPRHGHDDGDGRGQGHGPGGRHFAVFFDLVDVDANNQVSREEAMRPANQRFARIDADKDGYVTEAELDAANEAEPGRFREGLIDRLDADGDGRVSASEHGVFGRAMFAFADANDDGTVTYQEFANMRDMHRGGRWAEFSRRGEGPMGMADDEDQNGSVDGN